MTGCTQDRRMFTIRMDRYGHIAVGQAAARIGPLGGSVKQFRDSIEPKHKNDCQRHIVSISIDSNRQVTYELQDGVADDLISCFYPDKSEKSRLVNVFGEITHHGTLSMNQIIVIARKRYFSGQLGSNLTASVLTVLGTCKSIGCKVNGIDPKVIQERIMDGEVVVEDYLDDTLYS